MRGGSQRVFCHTNEASPAQISRASLKSTGVLRLACGRRPFFIGRAKRFIHEGFTGQVRTPSRDNRIYIGGYGETLFPRGNRPSRTMPTQKNWFEHALDLEIYHSNSKRLRRLVNTIFKEIAETIVNFRNKLT